MNSLDRPKVGVSVIVKHKGKVLIGNRKTSHGTGTWAFPGGHLEYGESFAECAKREVMEETGIKIKNIQQVGLTNDIFSQEHKHYITLFVVADYSSGKVRIMEPEKCEGWEWFTWENLPRPLFLPIANLLKLHFDPFR